MSVECKHCGEQIERDPKRGGDYAHVTGKYQVGMHRCATRQYGYNAEPIGEPCSFTCLGVRTGLERVEVA